VNVYFRLLAPSQDVRLVVVTVANRKVIDIVKQGPFDSGRQSVLLDLVDTQGKPLANGLYYLYVMADGLDRMLAKFVVLR
jgi:hypothetical protein